MTDEMKKLKKLASGIILAQGNKFIKELLREKKLRIGVTKDDFKRNMFDAIEAGKLKLADFEEWLERVEGWGDQHVYLFKIPEGIINSTLWSSEDNVRRKVEATKKLKKFWNTQTTFEYPEKLKLTGIYYKDKVLSAIWHQGVSSWLRVPSKDYEEKEDLDLYQYRAHRRRDKRTIMRFEMRLKEKMAAIFIPLPWKEVDHRKATQQVKNALKPIIDIDSLTKTNISKAIKGFDQEQLRSTNKSQHFKTQSSRLSAQGAYIEIASNTGEIFPVDITPIKEVMLAIEPQAFTGSKGKYLFQLAGLKDEPKRFKVQLYGEERRVRFMFSMMASEVWDILRIIARYS
jgi:hypothetical protein